MGWGRGGLVGARVGGELIVFNALSCCPTSACVHSQVKCAVTSVSYCAEPLPPIAQDGSTVAAILVLDDVVYSANLGDSKAVLCRRSSSDKGRLSYVHLTKDHTPSQVSVCVPCSVCCVVLWIEEYIDHCVCTCGCGVGRGWVRVCGGWMRVCVGGCGWVGLCGARG